MISVENITEQLLEKRFDSLPEKLKGALISDSNLGIVRQICKDHYLVDEEKMFIIQQIIALTILGFVHTYDVGSEINSALDLNNLQLSNSIAEAISEKIFSPIKNELESNYSPLVSELPTVPIKIEPAKKPTEININEIFTGKAEDKIKAAQQKPESAPYAAPEVSKYAGEFAELKAEIQPQKPAGAAAEASTAEPPPKIIHEELLAKPLQVSPKFPSDIPLPKLGETKAEKESVLPRPAIIEFGEKAAAAAPPSQKPTEQPKPRIVNYTGFKTPLDETRGKPFETLQKEKDAEGQKPKEGQDAGREVKEFTKENVAGTMSPPARQEPTQVVRPTPQVPQKEAQLGKPPLPPTSMPPKQSAVN